MRDPVYVHEINHLWVESAVRWGLQRTDDFNGVNPVGAGVFQLTQNQGSHWSAVDAYLRPAMKRKNLAVHTRAMVHRIIFDGKRATAVAYARNGRSTVARAQAEVLLCAGTINSPQLLMLSGIGPADHLCARGLDVVADLPGVGENLHDHPTLPIIWATRDATDVLGLALEAEAMARFQSGDPGPLNSALCDVGGFFSTTGDTTLNIQLHVAPTAFADDLIPPSGPSFTGTVSLLAPASRGSVRLRSANAMDSPLIDLQLFREPGDLQSLLQGVEAFVDMSTSGPFAAKLTKMIFPTHRKSGDEFTAAARAVNGN